MTQLVSVFCAQCGGPTGQFIERGAAPSPFGNSTQCDTCSRLVAHPDAVGDQRTTCVGCGSDRFQVAYSSREYCAARVELSEPEGDEVPRRYLMIGDVSDSDRQDLLDVTCRDCGRNFADYDEIDYE